MHLFSWLHKRMTGRPLTQTISPHKPTPRFQPQLETLERRDVPSTLTVTSTSWLNPSGLRGTINAAANGDTIVFAPSLDGQTIQLNSQLNITKSLSIQGPGAGLLTIRPLGIGESVYPRIFDVAANATVSVSGLTLKAGGGTAYGYSSGNSGYVSYAWDDDGGAILNFGTLTVSGCTLLGNSVSPIATYATYGGAIYNAGTLTLTGSTLSGNSACSASESNVSGRGGSVYNTGTATISGCILTGNSAGYGYSAGEGGGIYNAGPLTLSGCTVSGNSTSFGGGGIFNATAAGTAVTLTNDTVESNTATITAGGVGGGLGGGLYVCSASTLTLSDDTVQSNTAATAGGGFYIASGAAVYLDAFTRANVINNTAPTDPNIDGSYQNN
jgi:hypothetical protein